MVIYQFDGSLTGLLCCVFRAFQFKQFNVQICASDAIALDLFSDEVIEVGCNPQQATRVWTGLQQRLSTINIKRVYFAFLSEDATAHQHIFNLCLYVFQSQCAVDDNYGNADVLAVTQWAKKVNREQHRIKAFVRFKKAKDGLFLSLVKPDFNVLPLVEYHFQQRYQDQRWLIYDEQRNYGLYYDLEQIHHVHLNAHEVDTTIAAGFSQQFSIELDDDEWLYDQLWKDYFKSVNIQNRQNLKLHVQFVPKRYWRYLNEKMV